MSLFTDNVRALQELYPSFSEEIVNCYEPDNRVTFFPASTGDPTCEYKGRLLHSRHDPKREARRLLEGEGIGEPDCCVFAGFGLGYQIEVFLDQFPEAGAVIFEPDIPFFLKALETRDFTGILARGNITLLLGTSPAEAGAVLSALKARVVHVHILRPVAEEHTSLVQQLKSTVNAHVSKNEINRNTLNRFGKLWVRNLLKNLDVLAGTRGVRCLENRFSGYPSVMLAGGPSLDAVLPLLPLLKERFVIVAVDTSLRASLAAGVEPDFLVVVDPQYWNNRHLDNCDAAGTLLISESSTYPAVFRKRFGNVFFCSSLFPLGQFIENDVGIQGTLGAGGSVATTAWDFCRYIGSSEIVSAGLDLGYPGLSTHFKGSFFEERALCLSGRISPAETANYSYLYEASLFTAESVSGGKTLTDKRMMLYKWWFENQLLQNEAPTARTLSAHGLRIDGMSYVDLEQLLEYPLIRDDLNVLMTAIREGGGNSLMSKGEQISASLQALVKELEKLLLLTDQGAQNAQELEDAYEEGRSLEQVLERLSEIDAAISRSSIRDIAGFLVYDLSTEILTRKPQSPAETLEKSTLLYQEMTAAIRYHLELLRRITD